MICGTSSGGILAAGLSVPIESFSNTPKYKAYELLNLYVNESDKIFEKNNTIMSNISFPKYSSNGRLSIMNKYFKDATLVESLTDIVIPSVYQNNLNKAYLFKKNTQ